MLESMRSNVDKWSQSLNDRPSKLTKYGVRMKLDLKWLVREGTSKSSPDLCRICSLAALHQSLYNETLLVKIFVSRNIESPSLRWFDVFWLTLREISLSLHTTWLRSCYPSVKTSTRVPIFYLFIRANNMKSWLIPSHPWKIIESPRTRYLALKNKLCIIRTLQLSFPCAIFCALAGFSPLILSFRHHRAYNAEARYLSTRRLIFLSGWKCTYLRR